MEDDRPPRKETSHLGALLSASGPSGGSVAQPAALHHDRRPFRRTTGTPQHDRRSEPSRRPRRVTARLGARPAPPGHTPRQSPARPTTPRHDRRPRGLPGAPPWRTTGHVGRRPATSDPDWRPRTATNDLRPDRWLRGTTVSFTSRPATPHHPAAFRTTGGLGARPPPAEGERPPRSPTGAARRNRQPQHDSQPRSTIGDPEALPPLPEGERPPRSATGAPRHNGTSPTSRRATSENDRRRHHDRRPAARPPARTSRPTPRP